VKSETTFVQLVESIQNAHSGLTAQAGRAVNISLTLRNWLIGYYIAEYEWKIIRAVENEGKKSRELATALKESMALLKERRSALITAAVTG